ncbi:MAG: CHC2 zinc finger domain-containing protein [Chlamydiales bacterium]
MRFHNCKIDAKTIKNAINTIDFYLCEQSLYRFDHRSGQWAIAGLCPFHSDSKPGSFKVNLTTGAYKCFSCHAKGGDILSFVMAKYGFSFSETLEQLANEWGVS